MALREVLFKGAKAQEKDLTRLHHLVGAGKSKVIEGACGHFEKGSSKAPVCVKGNIQRRICD